MRHLRCPEELSVLSVHIESASHRCASPCVLFGDHRRARVLPPAVSDAWSRCMRAFRYRVTRSAIWLEPTNETYNLQIERIVRCACNDARQVFYEAAALRAWLADALNDAELARLDELLAEPL